MAGSKANKNVRFGAELTLAVERAAKHANQSISAIQDEIGHELKMTGGGRAIANWKIGYVPRRKKLIELLSSLRKRNALSPTQAERLRALADEDDESPHASYARKPPSDNESKSSSVAITRTELVGRASQLDQIIDVLAASDRPSVVGIDGLGGIGKSALANTALAWCIGDGVFSRPVVVSAQKTGPGGHAAAPGLTFERVLADIAAQLDMPPLKTDSLDEQCARIRSALSEERVLVLLDNLETAQEPQQSIIKHLTPLLGRSKVIATSRRRFSRSQADVYPISLQGISDTVVREFVESATRTRNIEPAAQLSDELIRKIALTCGGAPLAMQLVLGQLVYLPAQDVLEHLRMVRPLRADATVDEYIGLYRHIFADSWRVLQSGQQDLLVMIAPLPASTGGNLKTIGGMSKMPRAQILSAIDMLWQLSLVETAPPAAGESELRYGLHSLTQQFVVSDIAKGMR